MTSNKLFTNIVTGTAIMASLATSGYAGIRVFASKNHETVVPEVSTPTPVPSIPQTPAISATPEPSATIENTDNVTMDDPGLNEMINDIVIPSASPTESIMPSASPASSDFPAASSLPGATFDDEDEDDEDDELEHEERRENDHEDDENHESKEVEDHEDR
ncbi:MAG: hypothetical protein WAV40_02675 [Microgenomates group bacterium]